MNGSEISDILTRDIRTKYLFRGVFPVDALRHIYPITDGLYVINSDVSSSKGEHWLCIHIRGLKVEFFDSMGLSGDFYPLIKEFILRKNKTYRYNTRLLQEPLGNYCGLYVILYALKKARGECLMKIISRFSPYNQKMNDVRVKSALREHLKR